MVQMPKRCIINPPYIYHYRNLRPDVHNSRATSLQTHRRASSMPLTKSAGVICLLH